MERPSWKDRVNDGEIRRVITVEDFDEALLAGDMLNLWGDWTTADSKREQSIHISSGLVSPDKSAALLRALSTTENVHDYVIPSAGNDMDIDESGFVLKGWIINNSNDRRLDDKDRWAGGVSWSPPMPAQYIIDLMGIKTDSDYRFWRDETGLVVMASQVWGHYDEAIRYEPVNPEHGDRLQVSLSFMTAMLTKLDRDLIVEVQIDRRHRYSPYERNKDEDDKERIPPQARLYLLEANGQFRTL